MPDPITEGALPTVQGQAAALGLPQEPWGVAGPSSLAVLLTGQ